MEQMPSKIGPILKGAVTGLLAGTAVLLLFGLVGKSWVIGILAGICTLVGFFSIGFGWFYLKSVEKYYKAHPELRKKPEDEPDKTEE
jgi:hypothetical protein